MGAGFISQHAKPWATDSGEALGGSVGACFLGFYAVFYKTRFKGFYMLGVMLVFPATINVLLGRFDAF